MVASKNGFIRFHSNASTFSAARRLILGAAASLLAVSLAQAQLALPAYYGNYPPPPAAGQWSSTNIFYTAGKLNYATDSGSNRVPDFSYSGYHYGEKALPEVAVVNTIGPAPGDQTAQIQAALDAIGSLPLNANGHRGTLLLLPGTYEIWGTLRIRQSGVVLRGSGNGTNPAVDTILWARGNNPNQRTVVILGSNSGSPWSLGTAVNITNQFVQVGSMSVNVANASSFSVGQDVQIRHPSSQAWIDAIGGGGMVNDAPWTAGSKDLRWIRKIVRIEGTKLFLDAPVYNHLDRSLVQATIAPVTSKNLITEAGIENLRIDIETLGGQDEAHAESSIGVVGAENCWVQNINTRYFKYAGVRTSGAIRVTVKNCRATDPVAVRTGGNMYNFSADSFSQLILFTECHAGQGRHSFISNGTTTVGGVVWHRCTMVGGDFEAHRHWSQGLLLDNCLELGTGNSQAKLINRGDFGTSHGWGAAHSMIWKFNRETTVQKPPTAQNYSVTTEGTLRNSVWYPGPFGSRERNTSGTLVPESLYEAQLCDRLAQRPVFLYARHSNKAILVQSADTANGAAIIQTSTNGATGNEQWFLAGIGASYTRITARHSGKDMIVDGASTADGAAIVQGTYSASAPANDEWQLVLVTNQFYRIVNRHSGKVLGVSGGSTADGVPVEQMTWTGDLHQQFRLQLGPPIFVTTVPFQAAISPPSQFVAPGNSVNYTVNVQTTNHTSLAVNGLPANTAASFNPGTLTNSGSSTLTIITSNNTPLGSYPFTVVITSINATNSAPATLIVSTNMQAPPGKLLWTSSGGNATNWGNFLNWTNVDAGGSGTPGPESHLIFGNSGTAGSAGSVNNFVNEDYLVGSLIFTNTTGFHTTLIGPGNTLTIAGPAAGNTLFVGTGADNGANQTVTATITGLGGTLAVNTPNGNVNIRQGGSAGTHQATLNLSGLGTFNATASRVLIAGDGGGANADARLSGVFYLARTNVITASGAAPAFCVGDHPSNGRGNPPITLLPSYVYLGITNAIFTDSLTVGRQKAAPVSMRFNPAFLGASPKAIFRGADGDSRVGLWAVGDNFPLGSSNQATEGTNDFTGGTVDAFIDVLRLGASCNGNNVGSGTGIVTFASGIIDVNTLQLGYQTASSGAFGVGTINVNSGGRLVVNTEMLMARVAGGAGGAFGTLNVTGGTAELNNVVSGGGTSTIGVVNGTLALEATVGASAAPLTSLRLTNSTLRLKLDSTVTNIVVNTLSAGGLNRVEIEADFDNETALTVPLIAYSTFNGSVSAHFQLENVPPGYHGSLSNNTAAKTIELSFVALPAEPPVISEINASETELTISGHGGVPDGFYYVIASTNVALPLAQWTIIATNQFDANGDFSFVTALDPEQPGRFYLLQLP